MQRQKMTRVEEIKRRIKKEEKQKKRRDRHHRTKNSATVLLVAIGISLALFFLIAKRALHFEGPLPLIIFPARWVETYIFCGFPLLLGIALASSIHKANKRRVFYYMAGVLLYALWLIIFMVACKAYISMVFLAILFIYHVFFLCARANTKNGEFILLLLCLLVLAYACVLNYYVAMMA